MSWIELMILIVAVFQFRLWESLIIANFISLTVVTKFHSQVTLVILVVHVLSII
jgi:hypothetical protein